MRRFAIAPLLIAMVASAQPPDGYEPRVEDRRGHALDALHSALARVHRQQGHARLLFWGASHTASDQYTGVLRAQLQSRFGNAGPGMVMPAAPFTLYDHRLATVGPQDRWRRLRAHGAFGIALESLRRAHGSIALKDGVPSVDRARVFYLAQPGGGTLSASSDNNTRRVIHTDGPNASHSIDLRGPLRRIDVDARGDGPVRLMGVSLERNSPGVIVDTLGIPGARIRDRLPWNDEIVRAQVAALAPDLIVLAYGTNDTSTHRPLDTYRHELDEALRRARAMRPHASCLVIGPSDWPLQNPDGSFSPRPRTMEINHAHREAAARANCAFFDLVAFQGGPGSMPRWVGAGLALDDYVHFSDEGYRLIGQALARALLADYRE